MSDVSVAQCCSALLRLKNAGRIGVGQLIQDNNCYALSNHRSRRVPVVASLPPVLPVPLLCSALLGCSAPPSLCVSDRCGRCVLPSADCVRRRLRRSISRRSSKPSSDASTSSICSPLYARVATSNERRHPHHVYVSTLHPRHEHTHTLSHNRFHTRSPHTCTAPTSAANLTTLFTNSSASQPHHATAARCSPALTTRSNTVHDAEHGRPTLTRGPSLSAECSLPPSPSPPLLPWLLPCRFKCRRPRSAPLPSS